LEYFRLYQGRHQKPSCSGIKKRGEKTKIVKGREITTNERREEGAKNLDYGRDMGRGLNKGIVVNRAKAERKKHEKMLRKKRKMFA